MGTKLLGGVAGERVGTAVVSVDKCLRHRKTKSVSRGSTALGFLSPEVCFLGGTVVVEVLVRMWVVMVGERAKCGWRVVRAVLGVLCLGVTTYGTSNFAWGFGVFGYGA